MSRFVHLRVHSEYSLRDSIVRVGPLAAASEAQQAPALAITDLGNLSALVKFYRATTMRGIKPVIGADLWASSGKDDDGGWITLLCMNQAGFRNLSRLLTIANDASHGGERPTLLAGHLDTASLDGLIALSGAQFGEFGRACLMGKPDLAEATLARWQDLMPGRFYIELQRVGRSGEAAYIAKAVRLAAAMEVPVVATNDVRFITAEEFEAHETRVCIAQGRTLQDSSRPREYSEQQYLRSAAEMIALFEDLPEAIENTVEIARRCTLELQLGSVFLPHFPVEDGQSTDALLRQQATAGLAVRLQRAGVADDGTYAARLETELNVIVTMGFEGYFLIVADFISWSRHNGIPVGPGRGSGAGSLVAYALGITDLDPIEHELLFERFLNPERVSMPDFDIDFCIDGRDRVIEYVNERYGRSRVSQIITYGTMAAKAVVRDVGRVLGMPYGYVDRIAKMIPFEIGITLERALAEEDELRQAYESEEDVAELIDLALQLEGLARNAGTHAGGVVIAPSVLTDYMPLYADEAGVSLTQLDKDDLEAVGLVKFDFLGLKTLTIIDRALAAINAARQAEHLPPVVLDGLPTDDAPAYALLNRCETTAVFQLESRGMRDLIARLKPDCFDDLVAILALFRPGPLQSGMVDEFIDRKHAPAGAAIDYLHPSLEEVLKPTYGVILYQEQVMQIAQVLAGYSLGGADLLRRAMGKKKPEEMAKQREIFQSGAVGNGIPAEQATMIFDLMEKFAGYGFNKSHSAAYALIAYQTAWLKAHYPAAFMAAAMSADIDNTDKLVVLKEECSAVGLSLVPPDINTSQYAFCAIGDAVISYGLGAVKGVGRGIVEALIAERDSAGLYSSLLDLCRRLSAAGINRRILEALVRSGALDCLNMNRASLMNAIPDAIKLADTSASASAAGQGALFGDDTDSGALEHEFPVLREWTEREKLDAERDSLGLYLTGHPFSSYAEHCRFFTHGAISKIIAGLPEGEQAYRVRRQISIAGVIMDIRRRGNRVSLVIDDDTGRLEATLFDELFQQSRHLLNKHALLVIQGQLRYDDFLKGWRINAQAVQSVDDAIESNARRLTICMPTESAGIEFVDSLKRTLQPFRKGGCEVCVQYRNTRAQALLTLGEGWFVHPTRELRESLTNLVGEKQYSLHYAPPVRTQPG